MKKKIVWLVVTCLMVLALLAASCAKAEEKAPAAKEAVPAAKEAAPVVKEVAPAVKEAAPAAGAEMLKVSLTKLDGTKMEKLVEKPKYGGVAIYATASPILAWDEAFQAPWTLSGSLTPTNQDLVMGDWKRGLTGTGEFTWQISDVWGLSSMTGELAESWEFPDDTTVIYHIRKGVRWHNKPPVNGREFTADDVVFNLKRIYFDIKTSTMYGMIGVSRPTEVYATDKYTVVMKSPPGNLGITFEQVSDLTKMFPPDVVKKYGDHNAWENVTGTGPFLLVDYVPMSSATWLRNPNYWEIDPVRGAEYRLPYLDGMKTLIIPDISTRLAAMRTGKIDAVPGHAGGWLREDALPLLKTAPHLQSARIDPAGCSTLGFRVDKPELPFKDIRVRRALLMAVNNQEIKDTYYGGDAEILNYKIPPAREYRDLGWYTPLEQLPPSTNELYTYHPDKAKQLLTEAGYPNGFKFSVVLQTASVETMDITQMLEQYWAKIDVDLKIDAKEVGTFYSIYQRKTHAEALFCGRGGCATSMYMCRKGNMYNWSMIDDPKIDDYFYPEVTKAYFDESKRNKLMKEMNLYVLSQAYYYSPPRAYGYGLWQPWLKDYHAEYGPGTYSMGNWYRYVWLDQELKKAMGR